MCSKCLQSAVIGWVTFRRGRTKARRAAPELWSDEITILYTTELLLSRCMTHSNRETPTDFAFSAWAGRRSHAASAGCR